MSNKKILGNEKEGEIRKFIYKCLIHHKLSKQKITKELEKEFGISVSETTVLNYYTERMFWKDIEPIISTLRENIVRGGSEGGASERIETPFCTESRDRVIQEYEGSGKPAYLIELVAEHAGFLFGNTKAAKEGKSVLRSGLVADFKTLLRALKEA